MADGDEGSAFRFNGNWREFAPIALTNLLLIIVTLGVYRFWAKTRERRYLWSNTDFIGDPLEWTGTGKELFIGFVMAIIIFGLPLLAINFAAQAFLMRGQGGLAKLVSLLFSLGLFYVIGMGRFRALRYRLSRTYWHGIRGGSSEKGWLYGWSYVWKTAVGSSFFGLMLPWSMCELWNQRWNSVSFGSHHFTAGGTHGPLLKRLLLCFGATIAFFILIASLATIVPHPAMTSMGLLALAALVIFLFLIFAAYYAVFLRQVIDGMTLYRIDFRFTARSADVIKLVAGDLGLLILTLGLGFVFLGYRHWAFLIRHLEASGEVDLAELRQSLTDAPRQGEGLLDAFDVGIL